MYGCRPLSCFAIGEMSSAMDCVGYFLFAHSRVALACLSTVHRSVCHARQKGSEQAWPAIQCISANALTAVCACLMAGGVNARCTSQSSNGGGCGVPSKVVADITRALQVPAQLQHPSPAALKFDDKVSALCKHVQAHRMYAAAYVPSFHVALRLGASVHWHAGQR